MNKVEIKNFLGSEVRVVNNEYMVLKDMFEALGRVKEDGTWTDEKNKMDKFLDGINQKEMCIRDRYEVAQMGKVFRRI